MIGVFALNTGCASVPDKVESNSKPITHELFDELLRKHVTEAGAVNYKGFIKDSLKFNKYIKLLQENHPNEKNWSKKERLAYWINAYNAFTVQLIIRNYPVKSIKELGGSIYKVNTPWAKKFITIEGIKYSLDNIEHGIIRKRFVEPRIHFAVNCASESCPRLRNEAYTSEKLDEQLTSQAKYFIGNPKKNVVGKETAQLSKLFLWFKGDFTKEVSLHEFINKYSKTKMTKDTKVKHLDYSWKLNE